MSPQRRRTVKAWGIEWRSKSILDGERRSLLGRFSPGLEAPPHLAGYKTMAFETRKAAQAHIEQYYSDCRRPDLRAEPHGWRMPRAVRINVVVTYQLPKQKPKRKT